MPDSPVKVFVTAVNAQFDRIDAANETATTASAGIADDFKFLKETIEALQNNPGPISAEDQALLDAAEARVNTAVTKSENLAAALKAVDDATTPPTPPPA